MKRNFKVWAALAITATTLATTGCDKFLDVNENPNNPLTATPQAVLAQALNATATNFASQYNNYGNWVAAYWGKSGTVNGYNEERTYNYSSLYNQGLWNNTYDNLYDYQLIEQLSNEQGRPNLAAVAKIMKVYNFQLLVDQYGDIPYSQALNGLQNVLPKYDKAEDIYKDFVVKLTEATTTLATLPTDTRVLANEDIVFGGGAAAHTSWQRFANTLRLRILLRMSNVQSLQAYVTTEMTRLASAPGGFLTTDAQVQPGFIQSEGQQSPFYNRYGVVSSGLASATERNYVQPTQYIIDQYQNNGPDPRLTRLYTPATVAPYANVYRGVVLGESNIPALGNYARLRLGGGLLKAFDQPVPLILLAESKFLQAEAKLKGFLPGGDAAAKTDYQDGIRASFVYFYAPAPSQRSTTADQSANAVPNYDLYLTRNAANPLVNWDVPGTGANAVSKEQKIYYQKYLAFNTVESIEAWSEYRRTGYPRIPASIESSSTRPDKLPVRLLYPQTEIATNLNNIPTGINQFTSKIFWDVVD
ncbi:SusD/RagB family nutrient-binding outer membrane lipoprotein [Hymenobacter gummosus]|uniref:SusD/RagB family nutrient-binding outer membrane lipoprotein n=1 Tax=Hymenobacter gummosus TaxID=1776032 RepID=A0A3S0H716_9BACT|nr:SusD/RagB family nutrient-binding outer membrane lipoprotein [Hymenobacter gummosus]RTQ50125.1 SusD/RagB family nutrient-binding outer membrane lipoprotein [Hymenobacter gummosus]